MTYSNFSNQLIEALDYLCQKFGLAIDWTSANVLPILTDLADHYIRWEIATSVFWIVVALIFIGIAIYLMKHMNVWYEKDIVELPELWTGFAIAVIAICAIILICQAFDIIKCLQFPELQIIEYLTKLMKNM